MNSKAIFFLLGLAALCYAQQHTCEIRIFKDQGSVSILYDGTNNVAPFTGWSELDPNEPGAQQYTLSSSTVIQATFCDACTLTVYSTNSFGGRSEVYDDMESPYQIFFPFCIKSFILDCQPEEEIYFEPWTFTPEVIELRDYGLAESLSRLIAEGRFLENQYELVDTPDNTVEKSVNVNDVYQFYLTVKDLQNKQYIVRFRVLANPSTSPDLIYYGGFAK